MTDTLTSLINNLCNAHFKAGREADEWADLDDITISADDAEAALRNHIWHLESGLRAEVTRLREALQSIGTGPLDDAAPCADAGDSAAADFWRNTAYRLARTANGALPPSAGFSHAKEKAP